MLIIGCDYHPSFQQNAWVNTETGECGEQQLQHSSGEAERFYRDLKLRGMQVRVGMEATGHARWFERLLAELQYELWVGDPAQIKAARVRKQKTDRRDAGHILKLMVEDRFPRVWVPSAENRDLRQLLWHRHRLVQMRTRVMNQLQAIALNEGVRRKKGLWSKSGREQLESFPLAPWAQRRRQDLLELLDHLKPRIGELTTAIEQEAERRPEARRLMTHPGVGPLTALAFWLIVGPVERFGCSKQVSSYLGLVPCEDSSADRQRLGHISKQGNTLLRFLLVEAAQAVVRSDLEWRGRFLHLVMRRGRPIALVAMARKLAVCLYWMARQGTEYRPSPVSVRTRGSSKLTHGVK
jgi:transposase